MVAVRKALDNEICMSEEPSSLWSIVTPTPIKHSRWTDADITERFASIEAVSKIYRILEHLQIFREFSSCASSPWRAHKPDLDRMSPGLVESCEFVSISSFALMCPA